MTTTENSRADALTDMQQSALEYAIAICDDHGAGLYVDALRAILAASPVEQPAAAPIADREPPAVSDLPRFPTVLRKMWSGTEVQQWIDDNIKPLVQERHHDYHCGSNAAPSPADERAAFDHPINKFIPLHEDMLRTLEHVECVYRRNVVRDDKPSSTLDNLQRVIARARAASANETGAEGAAQWRLINPQGDVVAVEATCIKAWARISGYKPTVEGLLGYEEQGWRVLPTAPQPQVNLDGEQS